MTRPVRESVLRALVNEARERDGSPETLAVAAAPRWDGEEVLDTDGGPVRVAPCVSSLEVRDLLTHRDESRDGEVLVILTDRDEEDLGQEVLARVWRQRLLRPSGWEAVKHLFRVDRLDPALADARWLVDLLVDVAPPRGYPPPPSGFLEFGTAWRTLLRHGLRLDVEDPTLEDLLRWGETDAARAALTGYPKRHLDRIAARLEEDVGLAARHVVRIVAEGRGSDLVPLGLISDVIWGHPDTEDPAVLTARVRFEAPLGAKDLLATVARRWGRAATTLVREMAARDDDATVSRWLAGAETLVTELHIEGLAIVSDVLPWAFTKRLLQAGHALNAALDDPQEEPLERFSEALRLVETHLRAQEETDRVRRLRMAARLLRRRAGGGSEGSADLEQGTDLEALAATFLDDGAWVDAAREALGEGETVSSLIEAYNRLIERLDEERAERDRAFAAAFAAWSGVLPTDSAPLLPIERVLEEVVVPVATQAPTLFLVLDGLSHPEATRLFADLRSAGWREQGPEGRGLPYVVAAVPTVTAVSRTSLLAGRLVDGGQDVERSEFEEHPELRSVAAGSAPRLFHKKDLKVQQGRIAPDVRDAVLDPSVRIVGAVVNAVDDHLDKGSQLRLAEGLRALRPLRPLLEAAAEAGRAVIIASDHGHVLEHGTSVRVFSGSGERWRPADAPPGEDEVEVSGPRVLRGGGKIVAPAVETIRYMPAEKRGYHGGITPQEVLCPLTVITPGGVTLDGWEPIPVRKPGWWESKFQTVTTSFPPRLRAPEPVVEPDGQALLFTEEGEAVAATVDVEGWIGDLLESPIFVEQREAAGRQALDDDSVARFLYVLDRAEGVAPSTVLARSTDLPPSRVRTKLEALRRMLNIDGYPVLTIESDGTARLNRELLAIQFQVER